MEKPSMATIYDVRDFCIGNASKYREPLLHFKSANSEISADGLNGLLDTEHTERRTGELKVRQRRRIRNEDLVNYMTRPRTLVQCVFRDSVRAFIESKTGDFKIVKPSEKDFADYVLSEVFVNRELCREACDSMSFAMPEDVLNGKLLNFFSRSTFLLRKLGMSDTAECVRICLDSGNLRTNGYGKLVYTPYANAIDSVKYAFATLSYSRLLKIIHGRAGCGKTTMAIKAVPDGATTAVISLSNNIAVQTASKLKKAGICADPLSNTAAACKFRTYIDKRGNLTSAADRSGYDNIIIDEFSQWGLYELDILNIILDYALRNSVPVCIMGDELQIPSFLGRGSFLYSVLLQFPSDCVELKINHRSGDVRITTLSEKFLANETLFPIIQSPFIVGPDEVIRTVCSGDFNGMEIVTGSNASVNFFNYICACSVIGAEADLNKGFKGPDAFSDYDFFKGYYMDIFTSITNGGCRIRVRVSETFIMNKRLDDPENGIKLRGNEEFYMSFATQFQRSGDRFCPVFLESVLDPDRHFVCTYYDMVDHFSLAYAITVNKAQGLEWNRVLVIMGSIDCVCDSTGKRFATGNNFNLTGSEEAIYVSISRAKDILKIYTGDLRARRLTRLPAINLFSETI